MTVFSCRRQGDFQEAHGWPREPPFHDAPAQGVLARQFDASWKPSVMRRGTWRKVSKGCYEVRGKTLGIVGYGHIGSQVGVLAEMLGMTVKYFDTASKVSSARPWECVEGACVPGQAMDSMAVPCL